ncbi:MAG: UDP-N-acetylglucosamine 2-epimerase (hydrolyzing) [Alphaproteobacteria bacterium]|nr:UDP-N-acetylglucosamine 2-epimerase (hydrolyzing) [Alphaproteobacteria bacterium]
MSDKKLKICVVTGSRADYSYLLYPMKYIEASSKLQLQLVVTGSHLSKEFGNTVEPIKKDGFFISAEVPMLFSGDDSVSITKSMGKGTMEFADVFKQLNPDIVLVLGDRFEIFSVVQAALIAMIPVAHLGGGDVTEGAFDDAIRHSITKMSHLHFVTNEESKERILQMGENPNNVYVVGSPSLDAIDNAEFLEKEDFLKKVGFNKAYSKYILVTYHPETLSQRNPSQDVKIVLDSLIQLQDIGILITGANADTGGKAINAIFENYANQNENIIFRMSLGKELFYNALHHMDMFIGNSSSGLYEAPSFKLPVVNIGDRQKSRLRAESVIDCQLNEKAILQAIKTASTLDCSNVINPYGKGNASEQIVKRLEEIKAPKELLKKKFFKYVGKQE